MFPKHLLACTLVVEKKKPLDFSRGGRKGYFYGVVTGSYMIRPNAWMSRVPHTFLKPKCVDMRRIGGIFADLISF